MPQTQSKPGAAYLSTVRLSEKGQLVLPKEYRDEQNLKAGSDLAALRIGNALLLLPQTERFERVCRSIETVLSEHDLTAADFLNTLDETREELFAELYPRAVADDDR